MTPVTVLSKPKCPQCDATKRKLDKLGVPFTVRDIIEDPTAADKVRELGYQAVPVVITADDHWYGYRPDKLGGLIAEKEKTA